ncbi:MAG: ParB N-terminal domain-containing protein [Spirochaetes bacterium]|nr:ParB N-terminal domain-containing protein [Spirochaetota bacterium]
MEVAVNRIKIKKRIRKDLGNIDNLMNSMKKHGLINPIVINSNYELLAGYRRWMAAKNLKWKTIDVTLVKVTDILGKLNIELEENITRKDFTHQEMEKGMGLKAELMKMRNMHPFIRFIYQIYKAIVKFFCKLFKIEGDF